MRGGQDIGPYRVLRLVRRGGAGSVYLAHDARLNRRVALKLIPLPADREGREQLLFEAHTLARLGHNSVVQIFDVVETRDFLVLVMEYVSGCDLEALFDQLPFELPAVLLLASALCTSLSIAHREGIVHRDLKPANVLLGLDGKVKLGDFGIAQTGSSQESGGDTLANVVAGSYLALSPEQASGARVDQRSDLFSLGLLLYRMLCGEHPFAAADNELMLLQQLVHKPQQSLGERVELPIALVQLVDQLLEKDPARRPHSALEVRHRLMEVIRGLPIILGNPLQRLVSGRGRETDQLDTGVELPEGAHTGQRSHLFPLRHWFGWGLPQGSRRWLAKLAVVTLPLGLLLGMVGEHWLGHPPRVVKVHRPMLLGLEIHSMMSGEGLHRILLEEVAALEYLSLDPLPEAPAVEPDELVLQVHCNAYLCGLQLTRRTGESLSGDYRALLPDAPANAWQASINAALERLYPGF